MKAESGSNLGIMTGEEDMTSNEPRRNLYEHDVKLLEVARLESVEELQRLLSDDVVARGWVLEDEQHPYNPDKPFVVYEPMNRDPELWVAFATIKAAVLAMGIEKEEEVVIVFAPNSANWMSSAIELVNEAGYKGISVMRGHKQRELLDADAKIGEMVVSSYTGGRVFDDMEVSLKTIFLEEPEKVGGKRVMLVDDVLAQGVTLEEMIIQMRNVFDAGRVDAIAVLSKGGLQKFQKDGEEEPVLGSERVERALERCGNGGRLLELVKINSITRSDASFELGI